MKYSEEYIKQHYDRLNHNRESVVLSLKRWLFKPDIDAINYWLDKIERKEKSAELNDSAISQITNTQFVSDIIKKRFSDTTVSKVAKAALEYNGAEDGTRKPCVSRKIKIIMNEKPNIKQDQAVAMAINMCESGKYSASTTNPETAVLTAITQIFTEFLQ